MIDTVHVRVPALSPYAPGISKVLDGLRNGRSGPFAPSRFYEHVGSLREDFGIDAILHFGLKRGAHAHKIEMIGAGKKTLAEMEQIITSVFDLDPKTLLLMRADFAGDVPNVPVHQVRDSGRFEFKRFASQIDKSSKNELEWVTMGSAVSQSFYVGRRPNCFRIYNKIEELRFKWAKSKRHCDRFNRGLHRFNFTPEQRAMAYRLPLSFKEYCEKEGFNYKEGELLTRIERQIGGDRFPTCMQSFGDLYSADHFDPYEGMTFIRSENPWRFESLPDGVSIRDVLAARGLIGFRDDFGNMQQAVSLVMKHGNGNGSRILDSILPILPEESAPITKAAILDAYQSTTKRQIIGSSSLVHTQAPKYSKAT